MEDPVHGDQFAQPDKRVTSGLNASHSWHQHTDTGNSETTVGVQLQNDNIFNGLYSTQARRRCRPRGRTTSSSPVPPSTLKITPAECHLPHGGGRRLDSYRFDVQSSIAANSGESDHLASPSLSLIWAMAKRRGLRQRRQRLP
jgi:hypothetical protein